MLVGGDSTTTAHADPSRQRVGATAFGVAAFRAMESQSRDRPTGPLIRDAAAEAIFALVSGTAPKFTTDDPIPEVAVFGPATCVTIGELAAFSPEADRLGVSAADASYTIVTATKR